MIKVTLKDGSIKEVEQGISIYDLAKQISEGLARNATCARVDGKVEEFNTGQWKRGDVYIQPGEPGEGQPIG